MQVSQSKIECNTWTDYFILFWNDYVKSVYRPTKTVFLVVTDNPSTQTEYLGGKFICNTYKPSFYLRLTTLFYLGLTISFYFGMTISFNLGLTLFILSWSWV